MNHINMDLTVTSDYKYPQEPNYKFNLYFHRSHSARMVPNENMDPNDEYTMFLLYDHSFRSQIIGQFSSLPTPTGPQSP